MNLIGVVLPYFAKNDIAASPVFISFNIPFTDLSTNKAFWILFWGFYDVVLNNPLTMLV